MKKLNELKGVKKLSKNEQKALTGGLACIEPNMTCPTGSHCCGTLCRPDRYSC